MIEPRRYFGKRLTTKPDPHSPSISILVDGVNGGSEIVKMWKDYCKGILNSENSANESVESVEHSIDCNENYLGLEIPMCSVVSLISLLQKLPLDKAPGLIVFLLSTCCMQVNLCFFLSELFNMCIVHGLAYVPNSCLNITIVPICKNKNGNMSDTSNYRPVATLVSKILEHFI